MRFAKPEAWQVFQRDEHDRAPLVVDVRDVPAACAYILVAITAGDGLARERHDEWRFAAEGEALAGKAGEIAVGGPYRVSATACDAEGKVLASCFVEPVFAGDLWVLGGQSNMEGTAHPMEEASEPSPFVAAMVHGAPWRMAREPLGGNYTGPGIEFGKFLWREVGVPVGLIQTARGGTSIFQWDPDARGSLYHAMLGNIARAGGRVRGLAWYQGEADVHPDRAPEYADRTRAMVARLRSDLGDGSLAFVFVQLGACIWEGCDAALLDAIRQAQLDLEPSIPRSALAAAGDLRIWDDVHIDADGAKRVGRRLARLAMIHAYGDSAQKPGPRFERARRVDGDPRALRLVFSGVNGALHLPPERPDLRFVADDGREIPWTDLAAKDPNELIVRFAEPPPDALAIEWAQGHAPRAGIVDSDDMALPSFRARTSIAARM